MQAYYRYVTYRFFPISIWDDMCGWIADKRHSFILDWTVGKVIQYSNMNHPCPYVGIVFIKVDNISMDTFVFDQLLPAGRYRIDFDISDEYQGKVSMLTGKIFASVSDHRIEQF